MAYKDLPPLTDEDGDARELTAEDLVWFVQVSDFLSHDAALDFMRKREAFFRVAEAVGMEREAFLPFGPTKPGFEDRANAALGAILNRPRHAAE